MKDFVFVCTRSNRAASALGADSLESAKILAADLAFGRAPEDGSVEDLFALHGVDVVEMTDFWKKQLEC